MSEREDDFKWRLISVLFSNQSLTPALARALFDAAARLYQRDERVTDVHEGYARGRVETLGRDIYLGTYGGPGFEATLETERGNGSVHFFITREGLDYIAERIPKHALN